MTDALKVLSQACCCDPEGDPPYRCAFCHAGDDVRAKDAEIERLRLAMAEGAKQRDAFRAVLKDARSVLRIADRSAAWRSERDRVVAAIDAAASFEVGEVPASDDARDARRYRWLRANWDHVEGFTWRGSRELGLDHFVDVQLAKNPNPAGQSTEALAAHGPEASGAGRAGTCVHQVGEGGAFDAWIDKHLPLVARATAFRDHREGMELAWNAALHYAKCHAIDSQASKEGHQP